jgi:hypothetical protein
MQIKVGTKCRKARGWYVIKEKKASVARKEKLKREVEVIENQTIQIV